MAETAPSLETWCVATFDVVTFGLAAVLLGHASGGLADALAGIGTAPGALVFGYLWALVVLAVRWVLAAGGLDRSREGGLAALLVRGTAAGAVVGGAFVVGVILAGGLLAAFSGGFDPAVFAFVGLLGAVFGAAGGAVVGLAFALLNVGLYRTADLFVPAGGG